MEFPHAKKISGIRKKLPTKLFSEFQKTQKNIAPTFEKVKNFILTLKMQKKRFFFF